MNKVIQMNKPPGEAAYKSGYEQGILDTLNKISVFLGLYAPAPENAPEEWRKTINRNIDAWKGFFNDAVELGYIKLSALDKEL